MRSRLIAVATFTLLGVFAGVSRGALASDQRALIEYGCNDVVVIGRVRTVAFTDLASQDDVLGHGRYDVQVSIKRLLRGKETRNVVQVSGYSHGQMRADADFWIVLSPTLKGAYEIRTANLTR